VSTAPVIEPELALRSDARSIWSALVNASATWTELSPELFLDLDWPKLIEAAEYHGVLPVVCQGVLQSSLARTLTPEVRNQLRRRFQADLVRNLPLIGETLRVIEEFERAGVPIIPYKGPVLAEQLWGDPALRACDDLDFLVEKRSVEEAGVLLDRLGYRRVSPLAPHLRPALLRNASEEQFQHRESGLLLELQWSPAPRVFAVRYDAEPIWQRLRSTSFAGRSVLAPSPEDLLMLLSIHGWKHNWSRLLWVGDIAHLLRSSELDWDRLYADCRLQRNVRLLSLALRMSNRVYGLEVPKPFAFADPALDASVTELVDRMTSIKPGGYREWHRSMLAARDSQLDRLRQVATFFLTPGLADYAACNLPKRANAGYRAVRLGRLVFHAGVRRHE
jgi:hypothetical protein